MRRMGRGQGITFYIGVIREGLIEKVAFVQRPEGGRC